MRLQKSFRVKTKRRRRKDGQETQNRHRLAHRWRCLLCFDIEGGIAPVRVPHSMLGLLPRRHLLRLGLLHHGGLFRQRELS